MSRRQVLLTLFAALFVASVGGTIVSSSDSDADYTIRFSFLGSPEDEDYDGALVFKQYVESRSNGRAEVELYPSGQFCSNERECLEGMQSGVLQVFMLTTGSLGTIFGPGQVLDLPYTFRDDAVAECVVDGPMIAELRSAVLDSGMPIRLMAVSNTGGWRNFASTDEQIRSPADIKGRKFRTISAPVQQELVRQLGGNPTPVAWSEVYTALATGVVEGTKNGIQDIVGMKLHEQIKFITLDGHSYMGGLWWFSEVTWQDLPPDIQRIIYDGFQELKTVTRGVIKRREIDAYREFRESGGTLYVPTVEEKLQFREAAGGMRDWYVEQYGSEWLMKLDAAIAACEADIDSAYEAAVSD
ncbi:MAG: TRAP transporter substrate-binding protein DctP [Gammaproteobacteria bacterium]|nr:TRAP transporter substrate-binding protein DctP [Gammaproteobacteria bacterium]MBT8109832.1 TRAP transporter substrate-binding protein DctP [Gammaproteobacteria bacterium]NNL44534.1 TRAP transporter substrate-binding protein DctP [Woeseiaceae bacterium]